MSRKVVRLAAGGRTPMGPSETPRLRSGSPPSVEVVRVGRGRGVRRLAVAGMVGLIAGAPGRAVAHAFPERSEPRVGSTVRTAPPRVRIWFDGDLEPACSTLTVSDATGERVDRGDGAVEPTNRRLLQVSLPTLAPGTYRVRWRVLAVDGHRTEGDFTFTLKPTD